MDEEIRGLSALVDNLNTMPLKLGTQKNIIVRALRAGAEPIENRASQLAPVYEGPIKIQKRHGKTFTLVPGKLKQGMTTTVVDQTATGAVARIGPVKGAFYGSFDEFGDSRQPARPFLRPAFDEKLHEAVAIIGYVVGSEIEKAMANL